MINVHKYLDSSDVDCDSRNEIDFFAYRLSSFLIDHSWYCKIIILQQLCTLLIIDYKETNIIIILLQEQFFYYITYLTLQVNTMNFI